MTRRENGWDIASFAVRTVLTVIAAVIVVLQANGYAIDFERLRIEQLGLVSLTVAPSTARVYVDGKLVKLQRGTYTSTVTPDVYSLEVQLNGYRTWRHLARVESGGVVRFEDVLLFPERIEPSGTRPASAVDRARPLIDSRLRLVGTELWVARGESDRLVTRLSETIKAAVVLADSHIVYQISDGIHVIDVDGQNDVLLVAQEHPVPMPLMLLSGDRVLGVVTGETTTLYQIQ